MKSENRVEADEGRSRRFRRRLRGFFSSKPGKIAGVAALAAPVIAFVVDDLSKPRSLIRQLIPSAAKKLLPQKWARKPELDISDKARVSVEDEN